MASPLAQQRAREILERRQVTRPTGLPPAEGSNILSRGISDVGDLLGMLPRAGVMLGRGIGEVAASPVTLGYQAMQGRGLSESFRRAMPTASELGPAIGESYRDTARYLSASGIAGGRPDPEVMREAWQKFSDRPASFSVEHVGNLALVGAAVGRAGSAAAVARAGRAAEAPRFATRLRPLAGRDARLEYRGLIRDIGRGADAPLGPARPGSPVWQRGAVPTPMSPGQGAARLAEISRDIVGHPYISAAQAFRRTAPGRTTAAISGAAGQAVSGLPAGRFGTLGEAAKQGGRNIADRFYDQFPKMSPKARHTARQHQDLVREQSRDVRIHATQAFSAERVVPDAVEFLRAAERLVPDELSRIAETLPDRSIMNKIRGKDPLTEAEILPILERLQELKAQGEGDGIIPKYDGPEGELRLALSVLSLDEVLSGLPTDALVDLVPWMERFGEALPEVRQQQRALRQAGFEYEDIRNLMEGSERYILDERLLDPRIDSVLSGRASGEPPPPAQGQARLYRGESQRDLTAAREALPEGAQKALFPEGDRGAWFTSDREYALRFAGDDPSNLRYVDVPEDQLSQWQRSTFNLDTPEYVVPRELAERARSVSEATSTDASAHLQAARDAWRRFNDVDEQSLMRRGLIPEEGTRFRYDLDAEGNRIIDEATGEYQIRRVAEPEAPVPYEVQGPSKAQAKTLRRKERKLAATERAMQRTREQLVESKVEAQSELHTLERQLARDIEDVSKRARAAGDDPNAARLWDEFNELTNQYESLVEGGGLRLPNRMRSAMEEVQTSLDEVISLADTPALRQMLEPASYTRIQNALNKLRGAEEFLDVNAERMRFFDQLDLQVGAARGRRLESVREGTRPRGREARAERDVLRARQEASRAQEGAETLFDADAAAARLEKAVERYNRARRPFQDTLLKRQTRARERLNRARRQERSLERLEAKHQALQEEILATIDAAPSAVREVLWLRRQSETLAQDLDRMVTEGLIDAQIRDQIDIRALPETFEEVIGGATDRLNTELASGRGPVAEAMAAQGLDVSYIPSTLAPQVPGRAPGPGGGPMLRQPSALRRRAGGTSPLEPSFRELLIRRVTDLRVEEFKQHFVDDISTKFGYTPEKALRLATQAEGIPESTVSSWLGDAKKTERELMARGYAQWRPEEFFGFRQRRTGIEGQPDYVWMPKDLVETINSLGRSTAWEQFLRNYWNPVTDAWKRTVLALRPAWHVFNAFGNMVMALYRGGISPTDALDFFPLAAAAWRRNKYGYGASTININQLPMGPLGRRTGRMLEARGVEQIPDLPDPSSVTVFSRGITRGEVRPGQPTGLVDLAQQVPGYDRAVASLPGRGLGKVSRQFNRVSSSSYGANAMVDDMWRATIFFGRTMRHGDSPVAASAKVLDALGNYQKMTPFERNYIRSVFPFYAWIRHITGVTVRGFRPDSLQRTMMLGRMVQVLAEPNQYEAMLPSYARGDIHVGEDAEGRQRFLGTRGINPFSDVMGPITSAGRISPMGALSTAHPLIQVPVEQVTGLSSLSGRPFSTPTPMRDPEGRELPTSPGWGEQAVRAIPQLTLGRDVYRAARGETLTRYGTGEPLLAPGIESPPVTGRVSQIFGFNVRPIDVESMHAQRIRNRYQALRQELRYQAQLEASQQQRRGLPQLPSPLGPGQ